MIISCPSCATRFQAPAQSLGTGGRKVRCARCRHVWFVMPDGQPLPLVQKAPKPPGPMKEPVNEAVNEPNQEAESSASLKKSLVQRLQVYSRRRALAIFAGWLGLAVALGLLIGGGYLHRNSIVRTWPQAATLYAALKIPINPLGMTLQNVTYAHGYENGLPVLAIQGEIVNISGRMVEVPKIRVELKDAQNKQLYQWSFALDESQLPPSARAHFITRLSSPPADARHLEVRFAANENR